MANAISLRIAAVIGAAIGIAGCGSSPVTTVVGDDAALCRYATEARSAESIAVCRRRLDNHHGTQVAAAAGRIEGFALLNAPAPVTGLADHCRQPGGSPDCGDVTGSIKRNLAP